MRKTIGESATAKVFQFKITLRGSKPPIWRRALVPANFTLFQLHRVIQIVMPWTDTHLHEFLIGRRLYQPLDAEFDPDPDALDERKTAIKKVMGRVGAKGQYIYDFGDWWEHDIVLEEILSSDSTAAYPQCIGGARNCPPEDCGGLPGYYDRLIESPDPESEALPAKKEWLSRDAAQNEYELEWRNAVLKKHVK